MVNATVGPPAAGQGCSFAPVLEASFPFTRATHLLEVAARADRPAIHASRGCRPQGSGCGGRCRLVDQRPAVVHVAGGDAHGSLVVKRQGLEVPVAKAPCDLECSAQLLLRLAELASHIRGHATQSRKLSVLDALGLILQQMLRPPHPASRDRTGREEVVAAGEPQCDARGTRAVVTAQVAVERALGCVDAPVGRPRPGRRLGDQLQIARRELRRLHAAQKVVGLAPRPPFSRFAAAFDDVAHLVCFDHHTRDSADRA